MSQNSSLRPESAKSTTSRRASIEVLSGAGTPRINDEEEEDENANSEEDTIRPDSNEPGNEETSDIGKSEDDSDPNDSSKFLTGASIAAPVIAAGGTIFATSRRKGYNFLLALIKKNILFTSICFYCTKSI